MNVRDLYRLLEKVLKIISKHDLAPLHSELISHLATMKASPSPQLVEQITTSLENIKNANYAAEQELVILPHIEYLEDKTDLFNVVGVNAANRIEELWRTNQYFAQPEVEQLATAYNDLVASLRDTLKTLTQFSGDGSEDSPEALVTFTLEGEKSIDTTGQLQYRLTELDSILHGFARLAGDPSAFGSPKIRSLSKSSPGIIDIVSAAQSTVESYKNEIHLWMLAKGITWVLSRIEQIQRIRLNQAELTAKKFSNQKIEEGFDELVAAQFSDTDLDKFIDELIAEANPNKDGSAGSETEIHNAVKASLKKLRIFIQKGGKAKVYISPRASDNPEENRVDEEEVESVMRTQSTTQRTIEDQEVKLKELSDGANDEESADTSSNPEPQPAEGA